ATLHSLKNWSRVFDVGSSTSNNLFIAWSQGTTPNTDRVAFTVGGTEHRVDNVLAPFTIDQQHHIVLAIDGGGGAGGATRVNAYLDGALRGSFDTSHRLADLVDTDFWLGRSHYNDETANASYDEVRIHNRVYSNAEIQDFFRAGPVRPAVVDIIVQPPVGLGDIIRGVGVRFPLRALGRDALGRSFHIADVQWSSSNTSVATIDDAGLVQTHAEGSVEFTATAAGHTARWSSPVVRIRRRAADPYLATPIAGALWEVPVIYIEYFPTSDAVNLDVTKAPGFGGPDPMTLDGVEQYTLGITHRRKMMVEQGSRFRGYRDATALPSVSYRVVEHITVYDQIPPHPTKRAGIPGQPRYEDWHAVFAELGLEAVVRAHTVRELWVAWSSFDGNFPVYDPAIHRVEDMRAGWESNMSSPTTGDISNSDRDPTDAPVLDHTYIIYGINFRRSQAEAVHNVGHQVEAMFSYVAGRQDGNANLFWRDFVGQDTQGNFITGRAGWTHMPPNTTVGYDYLNTTLVPSDIEDWRPDNTGEKRQVNVDTWGLLTYPWPGAADFPQRVESQWYTYWFQNFPGRGNSIPRGSSWMTNWWAFIGNWDAAISSGLGLHSATQAATTGTSAYGYAAPADPGTVPEPHPPRPRGGVRR
ncbi:MAG TPA: LamG-like jellyroll fold domain-containing protein, partial [Mycobacterium sp.]|nr:LamG-like jellyroll fold domain-containing protein [Mycobacterium sp.]